MFKFKLSKVVFISFILLLSVLTPIGGYSQTVGLLRPGVVLRPAGAVITIGGNIPFTHLVIGTNRVLFNTTYFGVYPSVGVQAVTLNSLRIVGRSTNFSATAISTVYNWTWGTPSVRQINGTLTNVVIDDYSPGVITFNLNGTGNIDVEIGCSPLGTPGVVLLNGSSISFTYNAGTEIANFTTTEGDLGVYWGSTTVCFDDPIIDGYLAFDGVKYDDFTTGIIMYTGDTAGRPKRAFVEWDISSIPSSAVIISMEFRYHGLQNQVDCKTTDIQGIRPSTNLDNQAEKDALAAAIAAGYVYTDVAGFPVVGASQSQELGTVASTNGTAALAAGWFAIGILADDEVGGDFSTIYTEDFVTANPPPTLCIVFRELPINDALTSTNPFILDTYGWSNVTVTEPAGVANLTTVQIQVNTTLDLQTFTLLWTQATNVFTEVSDVSSICTLDTVNSIRVNVDADTDNISFRFMLTGGAPGYCDVTVTSANDFGGFDIDVYNNEFEFDGPVISYSFDDELGSVAVDWSMSGNNGTITGATRTGYGRYGRALVFDGTNDYVNISDHVLLDFSSVTTLEAWINTSDSGVQVIINKQGAYKLSLEANYKVRFTINGTNLDTAVSAITEGAWNHVVGNYNGTGMNIYINGTLSASQATSGAIATNANNLFVSNVTDPFNGTIDEVRLYGDSLTASAIASDMWEPIATFPYTLQITIPNSVPTNQLWAEQDYNFVGIFVVHNSSFPLDFAAYRFSDGFYLTEAMYDLTAGWTLDNVVVGIVNVLEEEEGNQNTITFQTYLKDAIHDILQTGLYSFCNDTSGNTDTWTLELLFDIYNLGGLIESDSGGDGGIIVGGGPFEVAAQNSSLPGGSWARTNITWRKLQNFHILVHWFQNTGFNAHWDCPNEHADTGYVEYGIDYNDNGTWIEGWKVHMTIEDGGVDVNNAWILLNVSWYNRGVYVKSDNMYAYYESTTQGDNNTQFSLIIDLWVDSADASSWVGGRVNSEYFGMNKTGWLFWTSWKPMMDRKEQSMFHDNLKNANGSVISAQDIELYKAWVKINKTSPDAGAPSCDAHQWYVYDYDALDYIRASPSQPMSGIDTPIYIATKSPDQPSTGFLVSLVAALTRVLVDPMVRATNLLLTNTWFFFAKIIDSAFSYFGLPNFVSLITTMVQSFITYMTFSITNITSLIGQLFLFLTATTGFIITWFTRFITTFLSIISIVNQILNGTHSIQTGLGNVWQLLNLAEWVNFVPVAAIVAWFLSLDNRARRMGGGWMSLFWGDLQMIIGVVSFLLDMMFRLFNFVIDMVFKLVDIIPVTS